LLARSRIRLSKGPSSLLLTDSEMRQWYCLKGSHYVKNDQNVGEETELQTPKHQFEEQAVLS
jgi:hypothetical protein